MNNLPRNVTVLSQPFVSVIQFVNTGNTVLCIYTVHVNNVFCLRKGAFNIYAHYNYGYPSGLLTNTHGKGTHK